MSGAGRRRKAAEAFLRLDAGGFRRSMPTVHVEGYLKIGECGKVDSVLRQALMILSGADQKYQ